MAYTPDPTDVTNPLDTVDASTAAAEFRALKGYLSTLVGGGGFPEVNVFRKNAIIGGDFDTNPWQRGVGNFVGVADGVYTADRWKRNKIGTMVEDVIQFADAPVLGTVYKNRTADNFAVNCFQANVTTAEAVLGAGNTSIYSHIIEGYNFKLFAQVPLILSFWHKHTKAGTYCVACRNSGTDRSFVAEYTQAVADTWEYDSIAVPASPAAGTWNYTTGIGLNISFVRGCGATFQTAAGVWTVGNFIATANQVNSLDTIGNKFRITLVQLEVGSIASKFERRSFQEELSLCQRYFQKTYAQGITPGTLTGTGGGESFGIIGKAGATGQAIFVKLPVVMRSTSSVITLFNPSRANAQVDNESINADHTASGAAGVRESSFIINTTGNAGGAVGDIMGVHWTADAEL